MRGFMSPISIADVSDSSDSLPKTVDTFPRVKPKDRLSVPFRNVFAAASVA